jgi:hypothetical protein
VLDGSPQCLAIQALGCVLPVELFARCEDLAHMSTRPQTERFHGLPQGAAEPGQFVIHARRSGREDSPLLPGRLVLIHAA